MQSVYAGLQGQSGPALRSQQGQAAIGQGAERGNRRVSNFIGLKLKAEIDGAIPPEAKCSPDPALRLDAIPALATEKTKPQGFNSRPFLGVRFNSECAWLNAVING